MPENKIDTDSTDQKDTEQGALLVRMPADHLEEFREIARVLRVTVPELARGVLLTFARSADWRASYDLLPGGIRHPDRAVALRLAEER